MKILTIGASPYLLVRNGKIHADVIQKLVKEKHEVTSAVWHHDESYFMPSEDGVHAYEINKTKICTLFPFTPKTDAASPFIYELLKKVQPQLVITIGDAKDTNFFSAIKSMYPNLFKWLAIYTIDCFSAQKENKDAYEATDGIITTSLFALQQITEVANVNCMYLPYGYDVEAFFPTQQDRNGSICVARNAQGSNLAAYIQANSGLEDPSYIHTNMYDPGDYNIDYLIERFASVNTTYTTDYSSIRDGVGVDKMRSMYNSAHVIVDCSMKSATALSLLEGMACGCVPVGPNYGRVGEIISEMPSDMQFYVDYNLYVGAGSEEYAIVSSDSLKDNIKRLLKDKKMLATAAEYAQKIASQYTSKDFIEKLYVAVAKIVNKDFELAIENTL